MSKNKTIARPVINAASKAVSNNVVSSAIAANNAAGAVATTNVLARLARAEANQKDAGVRHSKAVNLLNQRKVTNLQRAAINAKLHKTASTKTASAAKTAKYTSAYSEVTNLHLLAALLIRDKVAISEVTAIFIGIYAAKQQFDLVFVAARIAIYFGLFTDSFACVVKPHAKTLGWLASLNCTLTMRVPAATEEAAK